jgi:hypothetical protein
MRRLSSQRSSRTQCVSPADEGKKPGGSCSHGYRRFAVLSSFAAACRGLLSDTKALVVVGSQTQKQKAEENHQANLKLFLRDVFRRGGPLK